jgi:hypothetical protein
MTISYERFLNQRLSARWGPSAKEYVQLSLSRLNSFVKSCQSRVQVLIYNSRVEAIRGLFRGDLDAASAAEKLTEDVNASRTADEAESQLWRMWKLVADVSSKFPNYHDKLVDMINIIHTFPDHGLHEPGAVVKWADLPILGSTWAEAVFNCACSCLMMIHSIDHAFSMAVLTLSRE